jgi:hypothetical protein
MVAFVLFQVRVRFNCGVARRLGLVSCKLLLAKNDRERECLFLVTQTKMEQNIKGEKKIKQ